MDQFLIHYTFLSKRIIWCINIIIELYYFKIINHPKHDLLDDYIKKIESHKRDYHILCRAIQLLNKKKITIEQIKEYNKNYTNIINKNYIYLKISLQQIGIKC